MTVPFLSRLSNFTAIPDQEEQQNPAGSFLVSLGVKVEVINL